MLSHILLVGKTLGLIFRRFWNLAQKYVSAQIHKITYRSTPNSRTILVVGASFAGLHAAYDLANSVPTGYQVVVIEKNSHFHFTWVFPRFSVIKGHEHKAFVPYQSFFAGCTQGSYSWIRDRVSSIEECKHRRGGTAILRSGRCVEFDYLVLATGVSANLPSRLQVDEKPEGIATFRDHQTRIERANDIVIIGGGPAGIELAADAKTAYPKKNITLVHSRKTLLSDKFGAKLRESVIARLQELGVDLVLGVRPSIAGEQSSGKLILPCEKELRYDCLIKCTGQSPNSELMSSLYPSSVTKSGHIRVLPTLQVAVESCVHIFAAGDVSDLNEGRNGLSAVLQGQLVAQNIVRSIKDQELREYRPRWWEQTISLTLGLDKSVFSMTDGSAELTASKSNLDITLDSAKAWRYFNAKPFTDISI